MPCEKELKEKRSKSVQPDEQNERFLPCRFFFDAFCTDFDGRLTVFRVFLK